MIAHASLLLVLGILLGCGHPASPRKEALVRLPTTLLPGSATVSQDLARHAYLVKDSDGTRLVRDGVPSQNYRSATNRSYAPGSHRHVYWALRFDEQRLLVVDDLTLPIHYSRQEYVVFDPKSTHWAALATPIGGTGAIVFRDGETLGPFADASVPAWSPAGVLSYLRAEGDPGPERRIELVTGDSVTRESPANAATCTPAVGEPSEGPALPRQSGVRYLSDGQLLVLMPRGEQWVVTRGDETLASYDASTTMAPGSVGPYTIAGSDTCQKGSIIAATSLTSAEDAPVAAWWERTADGAWRVAVDGKPAADVRCLRPWPHQPPQLSRDGHTVAFPCVTGFDDHGEHIMIVHGSHRYGPYPEVWALALSDDGQRLAYGASNGSLDLGWAVYADGVQQSDRVYAIWRPRFDPSARHLAWEIMQSPKGPNLLVLDGRTLASFDDLVDGPIFDRSGEVGWLIRRKQRLARLNFVLPD